MSRSYDGCASHVYVLMVLTPEGWDRRAEVVEAVGARPGAYEVRWRHPDQACAVTEPGIGPLPLEAATKLGIHCRGASTHRAKPTGL